MELGEGLPACNEVKAGYINTEVGMIPEDWEVKTLDDVSELTSSKRIFESDYVSSGIPFYRGKEISLLNENKKLDEEYFISEEKYNGIKSVFGVPVKNDILITAVGTLGNIYLVPNNEKFYFKDGNLIWLRNIKNVLPVYLAIQLSRLRNEIINNAIGSSQKALTIVVLKKQFFPFPPTITEQTAIATALSDADALINSLSTLIAKKRNIKQGAMQQLLKPKEGWEVKTLGEIADFFKGKGLPKSHIKENGRYKCIHYGELFTKYKESISNILSFTDENENCFYSVSNDVLMPTSDVTPNGLATASCVKEDGIILGGDVLVIRISPSILDGLFLSFYVTQNREQVMKLVSGSTVYHLYGSDMKDFEIIYPKIEEQNEIATILFDMDAEIQALEIKLEKYRKIKLGMMQNLLTGKIRLV